MTRSHCCAKADVAAPFTHVCFSNRPFGVKHFQAIHRGSVDVTHGLALLFGIGTKALPSWDPTTRWNNLYRGLAVRRTAGSKRTCELTSSIVPRGTSFHCSVELECPPIGSDPAQISCRCRDLFSGPAELSAVNPDAVHDHGQRHGSAPRSPFSSRGAWRSASPRP